MRLSRVGTTRQTMLVGCASVPSSQSYLKNPAVYACPCITLSARKLHRYLGWLTPTRERMPLITNADAALDGMAPYHSE